MSPSTLKTEANTTLTIPRGYREIPFNYTSADDWQVVSFLLGNRGRAAKRHKQK